MDAAPDWYAPGRAGSARNVELVRRGVRHGHVRVAPATAAPDLRAQDLRAGLPQRWAAARALHLPGVLAAGVRERRAAIRASLSLFERLRRGASFQDALWKRLEHSREFEPAGVTVDLSDERELEKVFANRRSQRGLLARDLYAKLSWISTDERDESLRVRFSFGSEQLCEWQSEARRAPHSDSYAAAVFPESAVLTGNAALVDLVARACGRAVRFSERIVYNNAPGGGAIFHHDVEPFQLGVLYGQFAGATGWLALPKRALAALLAERLGGRPARMLRRLDGEDDAELYRLLNQDRRFTRRLVEHGAFVHLRAGDALLLPSPGPDDVCWHSVFALGEKPSLAHSYGIFARRR